MLPGVVLGTLLTPAAAAGAADGSAAGSAAGAAGCGAAGGGWLAVCVAGRQAPLWVRSGDLAPVPAGPPSGDEALAVARRLHGAAYVWGGLSTLGIDCSGLIHLAWRRLGVRLPRDAHDQSAATTPVPRGGERPGDLYFFARPGARPHHVGIVVTPAAGTTPGRMLHASQAQHRVVEEPMPPERAATLVGVRRP
ncbi:C40 family peptidase [Dactylosporangium sp. NBC_01737]|uniref:C40 family peptidase n=1 Tax=Dactylosporangium sp. NBC_01737 TaxID=2975959 RepID=UPI002E10FB0E|nr:C40 family peptidase [Dactylosporangium sp. NBC_01737]